ncbi:MAG: DUF6599 family protein [Candidatus Aminicenantia bacterium]
MRGFIFVTILITGVSMFSANFDKETLKGMLPDSVNGWKKRETNFYNQRNIFDYIDGAGELYISYNFKILLSCRYEKIGSPSIIVDLFDMGSPEDAFGVFTFERGEEEAGIGNNSCYRGGILTFWKSRYFVSIYAEEENEETKSAVFELANKIDSSIQEKGELPYFLNLFFGEEIQPSPIKFFHDHNILNSHYFVSYENILNLGKDTKCIATKSSKGEFLLVVFYPDEIKAKNAYRKFLSSYMPGSTTGFVKTENGKWSGAGISKNVIIVVFDSPTELECRERIENLKDKIEE